MRKHISLRRTSIFAILMACALGAKAADVLVEAESFANKGGWMTDQQFMDVMGSPYLLAHGMGVPVSDATTTIDIPAAGTYHVYARTYNWTSPWTSRRGAGAFKIKCGGKWLPATLGDTGKCWMWQYAGSVRLDKGRCDIALRDLTGFDGRCDAVYLTTERMDESELTDRAATDKLRRSLKRRIDKVVKTDFAVIGGGIAGMCAAVTAARNGYKVVLVNDRSVLGGNNSSEVRVHLGGVIELGPYKGLGRMIREFGHSRGGNAKPADYYEDAKKDSFMKAEPLVTLLECHHADSVVMNAAGDHVEAVLATDINTGDRVRIEAPLFADCTGDGTIGFLAGADYRMGRESKSEFNETYAPEQADSLVMGASVQWYSKECATKQSFPLFDYGVAFDDNNCEKVFMGEWTWETGMNRNQITDAERIRDYGLMVIYSNWSCLKNKLKDNSKWRNRRLDWVAYIAGKRESRRLLGDYILKQEDIDKDVFHEDASFTTSWSIDLHFADSVNSVNFPGNEFKTATIHRFIHPYAVPYRCLYSRNIGNLFMAGRDISVTHVALGTVRVMRTTGMMGEVVGMAASLCRKHNATPREIYWNHLPELKAMMTEGAGRTDVPDNQRFNEPNKLLPQAPALAVDECQKSVVNSQ